MRAIIILVTCLAIPNVSLAAKRIIGGIETTIEQYPFAAALLLSPTGLSYTQECVGTIINIRSVLTAAQCFQRHSSPSQWRVRVGSSSSSTGGAIHIAMRIISHENYHSQTFANDIAILRIIGAFSFNEAVAIGTIPRSNLAVVEDTIVRIVGWGANLVEGPYSDTLRQAQAVVINLITCRNTYSSLGYTMGTNVVCTSSTNHQIFGDACYGDTGGPIVHDNVIVGIISWTYHCGNPKYYSVNTRVAAYLNWIQTNQ